MEINCQKTLSFSKNASVGRIDGFTLIELLVVVLIIGILAAVALPQYRKTVLKSKITQAIVSLRAIQTAQEEYYLANGVYTTDLSELSIQVGTGIRCAPTFCKIYIDDNVAVEWVWQWGIEDEKKRCIGYTALGKTVCASYGGRKFRESDGDYYTMPL